jgi:hypothetical protein
MQEMATRGDVTIRIDRELRARARDLDINLSRLCEDALGDEIQRRETLAATLSGGMEQVRLDLQDEDGRDYVGKFTGKLLGEGHEVQIYLGDDERVIAYDQEKASWYELTDRDSLEDWLPHDPDVLFEVLYALGETPTREI